MAVGAVDADILKQAEEYFSKINDPIWRVCSGELYKIIVKSSDDDDEGLVMPFTPNRAQRRFIKRLWYRNLILKARQMGFTTLISILWLDHALFNENSRCGIIAHKLEDAEVIFRDKIKFAYDNLPDILRQMFPLASCTKSEMVFDHNNSTIRVSTSMRSGTIHRLHVSEYGKICAHHKDKAQEIKTGSFPAVPKDGIIVIESTAEGTDGHFYKMSQAALKLEQERKTLNQKEYRMHFYAWWQDPGYRMNPVGIHVSAKEKEYFDKIEVEFNCTIDAEQRAWYIATRDTDFAGDEESMWQEYPSFPEEAFQKSNEGCYYAKQMTQARKDGRILQIPLLNVPVNTFWDIGNSDGSGIWFHQQVGMEDRFIDYYEAHGEDLHHYMRALASTPYVFNKAFLPHDAKHKRLSARGNLSIEEQLKGLGLKNIVIVPKIDSLNTGIQLTRKHMASCYFDVDHAKKGISRLDNYTKKWNDKDGRWSDEPVKDINTEGADAFRQFAQAKEAGLITLAGEQHFIYTIPQVPYDAMMGY